MEILLISTLAIIVVYYLRQKDDTVGTEYENLVQLGLVLQLCLKHRNLSHRALTKEITQAQISELKQVFTQSLEISETVTGNATPANRPTHRTFQTKLKAMHYDWQQREVSRNQVIHSQTIRQCMYLLDETTNEWLKKTEQETLIEQYHQHWQHVFDSMEALNELRLAIFDDRTASYAQRVQSSSDKMKRKIEQLVTISPSRLATPNTALSIEKLNGIAREKHLNLSQDELCDLTTDISSTIIQSFQHVLYDVSDQLCRPIPRMWLV
ncbi:hypothetical protein [Vibrio sinaloensis]|uniref:hypothetical protein n=1 Tax=Photobacterium sp. (strain ATCC 43367) TaxID=379097 RepID=UPI002049CA3C|nr:hypothetical protein [Vibrio sinaloensis]UPQ88945.1 hypothetical protein MTO69_05290 [Vibrio sinaloensis]